MAVEKDPLSNPANLALDAADARAALINGARILGTPPKPGPPPEHLVRATELYKAAEWALKEPIRSDAPENMVGARVWTELIDWAAHLAGGADAPVLVEFAAEYIDRMLSQVGANASESERAGIRRSMIAYAIGASNVATYVAPSIAGLRPPKGAAVAADKADDGGGVIVSMQPRNATRVWRSDGVVAVEATEDGLPEAPETISDITRRFADRNCTKCRGSGVVVDIYSTTSILCGCYEKRVPTINLNQAERSAWEKACGEANRQWRARTALGSFPGVACAVCADRGWVGSESPAKRPHPTLGSVRCVCTNGSTVGVTETDAQYRRRLGKQLAEAKKAGKSGRGAAGRMSKPIDRIYGLDKIRSVSRQHSLQGEGHGIEVMSEVATVVCTACDGTGSSTLVLGESQEVCSVCWGKGRRPLVEARTLAPKDFRPVVRAEAEDEGHSPPLPSLPPYVPAMVEEGRRQVMASWAGGPTEAVVITVGVSELTVQIVATGTKLVWQFQFHEKGNPIVRWQEPVLIDVGAWASQPADEEVDYGKLCAETLIKRAVTVIEGGDRVEAVCVLECGHAGPHQGCGKRTRVWQTEPMGEITTVRMLFDDRGPTVFEMQLLLEEHGIGVRANPDQDTIAVVDLRRHETAFTIPMLELARHSTHRPEVLINSLIDRVGATREARAALETQMPPGTGVLIADPLWLQMQNGRVPGVSGDVVYPLHPLFRFGVVEQHVPNAPVGTIIVRHVTRDPGGRGDAVQRMTWGPGCVVARASFHGPGKCPQCHGLFYVWGGEHPGVVPCPNGCKEPIDIKKMMDLSLEDLAKLRNLRKE